MKTFCFTKRIRQLNKLISFSAFIVVPLLLGVLFSALAQAPQDIPKAHDAEPIDFTSPTAIVVYIVLPLFFIALYLFLKRKRRKRENK